MTLKGIFFLILVLSISCKSTVDQSNSNEHNSAEFAIVIHGGAGTITRENMTPEKDSIYRKKLKEVITLGSDMLRIGKSSEEVVIAVIKEMEDSPLFNAGKGAVFNSKGMNEMDASIMRGYDQQAGAISGVTNIKNPIVLASKVMTESEHVFLSGSGAEKFGELNNCTIVEPIYFYTKNRMEALRKSKERNLINKSDDKHGTVGCVALDRKGNITAGTSTGGMTNKKYNRIGDSPVIGAGTYANKICGISCTGHGEYFIRYAVAHDIASRMEYLNESVQDAAEYVVNKKLVEKSGSGGVIAMDKYGNIAMPFNTEGMYRAYAKNDSLHVAIYKGE